MGKEPVGKKGRSDLAEQTEFLAQGDRDFNAYFYEFMINRHPRVYNIGLVPNDWASDPFRLLNYVYKYEEVQAEFALILAKLGVEQQRPLPELNRTRSKKHYLEYYDDRTLKLACALFRPYMQLWGYDLPERIQSPVAFEERVKALEALKAEMESQRGNPLERLFSARQRDWNRRLLQLLQETTFLDG